MLCVWRCLISHVSQNPTIFCSRFVDEDDGLRAFSLNSVELYRKETLPKVSGPPRNTRTLILFSETLYHYGVHAGMELTIQPRLTDWSLVPPHLSLPCAHIPSEESYLNSSLEQIPE